MAEPDDDAMTVLPVVTDDRVDGDGAASAGDRPRARRRGRGPWIGLGVGLFLVLGAGVAYLVELNRTAGQIDRGTSIAGIQVGALTPAEATERLTRELAPRFAAPLTLEAHSEKITLDPAGAGLSADIEAAVAAAGLRSSAPWDRLMSFHRSVEVPLAVTVDEAALRAWVAGVAERTDVEPVEGQVARRGVEVVVVDPVVGRHLRQDEAVTAIATAWRTGDAATLNGLDLPTTTEPVRVSAKALAAAKVEAETLLRGDLTVKTSTGTLIVPAVTVAKAVTIRDKDDGFAVGVDSAVLRAAIEKAATATQTTPKDAGIALTDGRPTITPGVTGRTVDWDATEAAAGKALMSGKRVWTVIYTTTEPEFSTADAKAYGLTEVIGEFTTGGFAYASGQNVKVVAEKVQGALIRPGETFSLNTFTGQRTEAEGYIPAGVIDNGVIGTAVGGGISQFATTLYNAAYFAGMADVTHTPHSFYISRYPLGREATVYDGLIDLAFANDYDTAVMIQTIWTESDITVRIWGTKHVVVESETGEPFGYTAPETRTIPYGQSCSASSGSSGYSVVNTRIIKDLDGKVVRREPFTTVYNGQVQVICQPAPAPATPAAPATSAAAPATPAPGG